MPSSVTPAVKAMLRRKNRLMHAGHTQEAGAITKRVRAVITQRAHRGYIMLTPESIQKKHGPKYVK